LDFAKITLLDFRAFYHIINDLVNVKKLFLGFSFKGKTSGNDLNEKEKGQQHS
jgi:hypothetical protein